MPDKRKHILADMMALALWKKQPRKPETVDVPVGCEACELKDGCPQECQYCEWRFDCPHARR